MENTIEMYGGKIYGVAVSEYGLEKGYLDYRALDYLAHLQEDIDRMNEEKLVWQKRLMDTRRELADYIKRNILF